MKPSELFSSGIPAGERADISPFDASSLADPPITAEDVRIAQASGDYTTVCRWHKGHISHSPTSADTEGRVFYCPIGRQWWRYSKQVSGLYAPLKFSW